MTKSAKSYMKSAVAADRKIVRWGITLIVIGIITGMVLALCLSVNFSTASASPVFATPLCGDGSAPDYGFTYDLQQRHWTVDWQDYASEQAVTEVDSILDQLNADSIAQTMILFKSPAQVGNRVNCAVHFLRYMQLGLPRGERKDNGFVFLVVAEPTRIDVHYGVGLGLPALTASDLTTLNRAAEDSFQSTRNMDQALLTLVRGFDTLARSKYAALISPTTDPEPETIILPQLPSGPLGILTICGLLCLGVPIFLWIFLQMLRNGISFNQSGRGFPWGGGGNPFGGGRRGWGGGGGLGGGGGWGGGQPTRGGGGSGRSGRGN